MGSRRKINPRKNISWINKFETKNFQKPSQERVPPPSGKIEEFLIAWRMQKRGKRLGWLDYSYECYNTDATLICSTSYDTREFPALQLHKIPKNFNLQWAQKSNHFTLCKICVLFCYFKFSFWGSHEWFMSCSSSREFSSFPEESKDAETKLDSVWCFGSLSPFVV